jgi:pimeloyl-ACP methyl ester carboxylesterase
MIRVSKCWLPFGLACLWVVTASGVELEPCEGYGSEDRAECGTITVLEDRSKLNGRKISLNVLILRAESPDGSAPLFLLAGGPGQGATDLAGLAFGPYAGVRKSRDVVLVDQRGTGASNRLDCPNDSDADPQAAFGGLFDPEQIAACAETASQHADLRLYGTSHVVADLDEVRDQLGYERVVLWGGSGGTRTALVWLRDHPDRVEAIAIDGVTSTYFRAPSGYAPTSSSSCDGSTAVLSRPL